MRGVRLVALLNNISVWWQVIGVAVVVLALVVFPSTTSRRASSSATSSTTPAGDGASLYVSLLGLLLAQYTLTGFDASAHMTEETHDAARSGPRQHHLNLILVSLVAGWILLIGVTFAIQSYDGALGSSTGVPGADLPRRPGRHRRQAAAPRRHRRPVLLGMSSVTANCRMIYAFSRDGALPGSAFWHRISDRTRTPSNAVWLAWAEPSSSACPT